jgi:hypothetical protein
MATKSKKTAVVKTEVEHLTGTIHGARYTVVLDDVARDDVWEAAVLPMLQKDGLGKVNLVDGVTEFVFKDAFSSTIQFSAKEGKLAVSKFFILTTQEATEDDSATESV